MLPNRIDAELSENTVKEILETLNKIEKQLNFLQSLTPEERLSFAKMGDKSRAFVTKALDIATQNSEVLPRYFDINEMKRDVALYLALSQIDLKLSTLREKINDTLLLTGGDAYAAALAVYSSIKNLPAGAGLTEALDELGKRFARKAKTDQAPNNTP